MAGMIKTLLLLASKSAWSRKGSLMLLLLSVITSTCLLLGIDLARQSAKASFSNAVAGTDLIVGAQTSPVSLLLYSVFRNWSGHPECTVRGIRAPGTRSAREIRLADCLGRFLSGLRSGGHQGGLF